MTSPLVVAELAMEHPRENSPFISNVNYNTQYFMTSPLMVAELAMEHPRENSPYISNVNGNTQY